MIESLKSKRILIYSHDSFGLGHLRRCRTIAHSLVEQFKGLTILILSGSPIIGNFDYKARVDFIRIPGVIKLYNGLTRAFTESFSPDNGSSLVILRGLGYYFGCTRAAVVYHDDERLCLKLIVPGRVVIP